MYMYTLRYVVERRILERDSDSICCNYRMAAALNSSTALSNCAASLCSSASVDSVLVAMRLSSVCTSVTSSDATSEAWEVEWSACSAAVVRRDEMEMSKSRKSWLGSRRGTLVVEDFGCLVSPSQVQV